MSTTVGDLLGTFAVRVLIADGALDTEVQGVHVSDLLDPTPWLSRGDVLLTTGSQLQDADSQRAFIALLAAHQISALGFGTGFEHASVPAALVDAAEQQGLALFEVPPEVPFVAITSAVNAQLAHSQRDALERALTIQDRLESSIRDSPGLETLAASIADLMGAAVTLFDGAGRILAIREPDRPLSPTTLTSVRSQLRDRDRRGDYGPLTLSTAGRSIGFALAVSAYDGSVPQDGEEMKRFAAWLVAINERTGLSDLDRAMLRQALPLAELELLRHRLAEDARRRRAIGVLSALTSGELAGDDLAAHLASFGIDGTVAAIVAQPTPELSGRAVEAALSAALARESAPALVAFTDTLVTALIPGLPDLELFDLAGRAAVTAGGELGARIRIGVGRATEVAQARRTLDEARGALEARALAKRDDEADDRIPWVATFRDLGSLRLLLAMQDNGALRQFCDSILGPIEDMENDYGGELLRSLQVFIETNGQWERAAKQLFCHRHTLRYRIRKIEELTGRDLESASDRIEFYLALRARGVLS
jgi:purine catabolism regulator